MLITNITCADGIFELHKKSSALVAGATTKQVAYCEVVVVASGFSVTCRWMGEECVKGEGVLVHSMSCFVFN